MANSTYVPTGTHFDAWLTPEEKRIVEGYQQQWVAANAAGDVLGMSAAHTAAELIRANSANPYSGGGDGSEFIPLAVPADRNNGLNGSSSERYGTGFVEENAGYKAAELPKAQSMENYINALYAAQEDLALEQLRSQYEQNVLELDSTSAKIPAEYATARNIASTDNEIVKSAFNERAAAHGLSSGTGTQATLSMNNALLGNLASISTAEADAIGKVELTRNQLKAAYSSNITKAIAENNLEKAAALYKELARLDEAEFSRALAQANENYRAYQTIKV